MAPWLRSLTLALSLGVGASQAQAQNLIVGTASGGNCYPFICASGDQVTRFQQVYRGDLFGTEPVGITGLFFFTNTAFVSNGATWDDAPLTVSLSTTTAGFPLATNAAANVGADARVLFSGVLTGEIPSNGVALAFDFASFTFDPTLGNLLLDVTIGAGNGDYVAELDSQASCSTDAERLFVDPIGTEVECVQTLVTGFTVGAVVPEPDTSLLLAGGLAGVWLARRRRLRGNAS